MVTDWAVSVSLRSISPPVTTTRSDSAVFVGDGEGFGVGDVVGFWAETMPALTTGVNKIKINFFKVLSKVLHAVRTENAVA